MDPFARDEPKCASQLLLLDGFSIAGDLEHLDQQFGTAHGYEEPLEDDIENDAANADQLPSYEDATSLRQRPLRGINASRLCTLESIGEDAGNPINASSRLSRDKRQRLSNSRSVAQVRPGGGNSNVVISLPIDARGNAVDIGLVFDSRGQVVGTRNGQIRSAKEQRHHKQNIPEPKIEIKEEHIHVLSEHVGKCWRVLAKRIGVSNGQIENICSDGAVGNFKAQIRIMLEKWHQIFGKQATIDYIIKSLKDMQQYEIAKKLIKVA